MSNILWFILLGGLIFWTVKRGGCCGLRRKEAGIMAKDPVCGMEVEEGKICSEYEGRRYCFCCEACKQKFEQEPKKYTGKSNCCM